MAEVFTVIVNVFTSKLPPSFPHTRSKCYVTKVYLLLPFDFLLGQLLRIINLSVEYLRHFRVLDFKILHDLIAFSLINQILQLLLSLQWMQGNASGIVYLLQSFSALAYFLFQDELAELIWNELSAFHFFNGVLGLQRDYQLR